MFDTILSFLTGGGSSMIGGLVTSIGGGIIGLLGAKGRQKHDLSMRKVDVEAKAGEYKDRNYERAHELLIIDHEAKHANELALIRKEEKEEAGSISLMLESFKNDAAKYSQAWASKVSSGWASIIGVMLGFVDVLRGSVRPVITYTCGYLLLDLWWTVKSDLMVEIAANPVFCNYFAMTVVDMILFIISMTIGWWFGSRPSKPPRTGEVKALDRMIGKTV